MPVPSIPRPPAGVHKKKPRLKRGFLAFQLYCRLARAVAAALHTGHHGALVVRGILSHLSGLFRGPSLAFGLFAGLLLRGLAVLRVHENLTHSGTKTGSGAGS